MIVEFRAVMVQLQQCEAQRRGVTVAGQQHQSTVEVRSLSGCELLQCHLVWVQQITMS